MFYIENIIYIDPDQCLLHPYDYIVAAILNHYFEGIMMTEATVTKNANRAKKSPPKAKSSTVKSPLKKKSTAKKKSPTQKRMPVRRNKAAANRKSASSSKKALVSKLRADLKASKEALKSARVAAREELKLVKAVAKDEIAVLKDQLAAAIKKEKELIKISKNKTIKMIAAGERWEKEQLTKIKNVTARARRKLSR